MFTIFAIIIYLCMLIHTYRCTLDIDCISDIAYDKHYWMFIIAMTAMSVFLYFGSINKTPEDWRFLVMLSSICCVGVGITPYKNSNLINLHKFCAIVGMSSIIGLWIIQGQWWMPFLFMLAGLRKKWLLGIEMGILTSAFAYAL